MGQQVALAKLMADVADNPEKYATMQPEEFARTWFPQLHRSDRDRASGLLASMHAQANKPDKLSPIEQKMLLQLGREAGVFDPKQNDVSKWNDDDAQNFYVAQQRIAEMIATEKTATGKAPDLEKVKKWITEELLRGGKQEGKGFFGFGGNQTRLEAEAKGELGGYQPKWSDDEKATAIEELRKAGARIDDAALELYLRTKHGLPALPTQATTTEPPEKGEPGWFGLDLVPLEEQVMTTDRPMDKR
jgi:hypothetical protein